MDGVSSNKYSQDYLNGIQEKFNWMDKSENGGNGDGQISTNEVFEDLDIGGLLANQNQEDASKIFNAAKDMGSVLEKYAGADGIFSAEEYAEFLNGDEWGAVLDAWHTSGAKAELEMNWIDNERNQDGATTKGEVKVGLLNNLDENGYNIDTKSLESLVDKYAGDDGAFTRDEYRAMLNDELYQQYIDTYHIRPWFNYES